MAQMIFTNFVLTIDLDIRSTTIFSIIVQIPINVSYACFLACILWLILWFLLISCKHTKKLFEGLELKIKE